MKQMVERQFINRAYSFTALAAKEGYDPIIDYSGADEEMNDFEEGEEEGEEEGVAEED